MRYFAAIAAALCSIWLLAGCGSGGTGQSTQESGSKEEAAETETQEANADNAADTVDTSAMDHVQINVKDYGTITLALDAEAAPATVENFEKLVKEGFYDGLTFHRIMDGFMIQGGDPLGNGTGGSDETIVGEFAANGYDNPISHVKGVISMARAMNPDSASSQFFIVHQDSEFLDGFRLCDGGNGGRGADREGCRAHRQQRYDPAGGTACDREHCDDRIKIIKIAE